MVGDIIATTGDVTSISPERPPPLATSFGLRSNIDVGVSRLIQYGQQKTAMPTNAGT